jgi:hypothetical protein
MFRHSIIECQEEAWKSTFDGVFSKGMGLVPDQNLVLGGYI